MRRALPFCLLLCLPIAAQEAPIPTATELPGSPFFIEKTWFIGGAGNWDYLTLDPAAQRLYIAHSAFVQVVDIDSGAVVGEIPGFREAHAIALDGSGTHGYVSDGPADEIKEFDRRSLQIESTIPISCSPRSIAFEPASKLLFAICGANAVPPAAPLSPIHRRPGGNPREPGSNNTPEQTNLSGTSHVVLIDSETKSVVADMILPGDFRFAQPDSDGHVYVSVGPAQVTATVNGATRHESVPQRIAKLNAAAIAQAVRQDRTAQMDWIHDSIPSSLGHFLPLDSTCTNPEGLAVDQKNQRLFITCDNQRFEVLDSNSGAPIAALVTGPGNETIGYDQDREMIFVANGAGYGSLTIIQQDATTDSYAVIQNLPTRGGARTLAVDPTTGEAYLVTDFQGVDLTKTGGIGTLHAESVPGSFQVLVIGH